MFLLCKKQGPISRPTKKITLYLRIIIQCISEKFCEYVSFEDGKCAGCGLDEIQCGSKGPFVSTLTAYHLTRKALNPTYRSNAPTHQLRTQARFLHEQQAY